MISYHPLSNITHPLTQVVLTLLTAFCLLPSAFGQTATATLSGTVLDPNGAVVPAANITVTEMATGVQRTAATSEQGYFTIPLLKPSTYLLQVEHPGFMTAEVKDLILNVGDERALKIQMKVGDIKETVNVTTESSRISETVGVGTVVDRKFVENLPLNGRGFNSLVELTPGVVTAKSSFNSQGQFSVNGQRSSSNYFSVDGVSANTGVTAGLGLNQTAAGTLPTTSILGGMNALVSVDALQEFRVQTSTFAPEYGRTSGAQISIITRSGTNQFHGNLFDYFRNDKLDANNWFANSTAKPRPPLRQNDFGGTLSGPVLLPRFGEGGHSWYNGRNRTLFFFSYEGLRLRQPQTVVGFSVPSLVARQAAPASLRPYLDAFPLPNGPDLPNGFATENATFSNPATFNATSIRIDQTIGRSTLFGRYADSPSSTTTRGVGSANPLSQINHLTLNTRSFTIGATSLISSAMTNDARFNWTSSSGTGFSTLDNFGGAQPLAATLLFPSYATPDIGKSSITLLGGVGNSLGIGKVAGNFQRQVNLVDTVSISNAKHIFKFGGDIRILRPVVGSSAYSITASFAGVGNPALQSSQQTPGSFLSGLISSGSVISRPNEFGMQFLNFSSFGQDTWKATSRLTITYGARWDIFPPPTGTGGKSLAALTSITSLTTLAYAQPGTPLWKIDYKNIAPRVGIAYQLRTTAGRELVLRAGTGIFYDLPSGGFLGTQPAQAPNVSTRTIAALTPFPYSSSATTPAPLPASPPYALAIGIDPDFKTARVYEWNAALEQQLARFGAVSATYVGAIGRDLGRGNSYSNPNPTFSQLLLVQSNATSDYHALQLQYRGQIGQRVQGLASYSWSHSIDSASTDSFTLGVPFSRIDPKSERGPSDFDVRHSVSGALIVSSPQTKGSWWSPLVRNWSLDMIFQARTAFPFDVTYARDLGFGTYLFRPDIDTTKPVYVSDPAAPGGRRLDNNRISGSNQVGAFIIPTDKRQGNLERNATRGFGMWQADLDLRREFTLKEGLKFQLKMEMFNILNHPNFNDPASSIGSVLANGTFTVPATFGRSQSMLGTGLGSGGVNGGLSPLYQLGGARSTQFSMKLIF